MGESAGLRSNVGSGRSKLEDLDATLERRQPLIDVGEQMGVISGKVRPHDERVMLPTQIGDGSEGSEVFFSELEIVERVTRCHLHAAVNVADRMPQIFDESSIGSRLSM